EGKLRVISSQGYSRVQNGQPQWWSRGIPEAPGKSRCEKRKENQGSNQKAFPESHPRALVPADWQASWCPARFEVSQELRGVRIALGAVLGQGPVHDADQLRRHVWTDTLERLGLLGEDRGEHRLHALAPKGQPSGE